MNNPVIDREGNQRWFNELGKLHRTDGPAVIYSDDSQAWFLNGQLHRTDGPAVIYSNGSQWALMNTLLKDYKRIKNEKDC